MLRGADSPHKSGSVELLAILMGELRRVIERVDSMEKRLVEGSMLPDELPLDFVDDSLERMWIA